MAVAAPFPGAFSGKVARRSRPASVASSGSVRHPHFVEIAHHVGLRLRQLGPPVGCRGVSPATGTGTSAPSTAAGRSFASCSPSGFSRGSPASSPQLSRAGARAQQPRLGVDSAGGHASAQGDSITDVHGSMQGLTDLCGSTSVDEDDLPLSMPSSPGTISKRGSRAGDLLTGPATNAGRADRMKAKLDYLKREQTARDEQMAIMRNTVSECNAVAEQSKQRSQITRNRLSHHQLRFSELDDRVRAHRDDSKQQDKISILVGGEYKNKKPSLSPAASRRRYKARPKPSIEEMLGMPTGKPRRIIRLTALEAQEAGFDVSKAEMEGDFPDSDEEDCEFEYELEESSCEEEPADLQPCELAEFHRNRIRQRLLEGTGNARKAFRAIDLNGSGSISCQEFGDGLERLGVNWKKITKLTREGDVFKLFDQVRDWRDGSAKDGVITFRKLFPSQAKMEEEPKEQTVHEFWRSWCHLNDPADFQPRPARWCLSDTEEQLDALCKSQQRSREVADRRKWMAASFGRLKNKGKSDARVRECIAIHLPRGTGPRDRDACPTFSEAEVLACRKAYTDGVNEPVKNVQKVVYDMREQTRTLNQFRMKLHAVSAPNMMTKVEEERKQAVSSFAGLGLLGKGKADEEPKRGQRRSLASIAKYADLEEEKVRSLQATFAKHADEATELLTKMGFAGLVREIGVELGDLAADDILEWWNEAKAEPHSGDKEAVDAEVRHERCNFEQFSVWYANSPLLESRPGTARS